jgi:hypothetical protein
MSRPITTSVTIAAAVANGLAQAQQLFGAGSHALALNGSLVAASGIATLDAPRRVIIASAGNDSGINFTVVGTARPEQGGIALTETVAGTNGGTAQTTQDFATVSSITASGATAGNVTAGTNGVASGPWVVWDQQFSDFQVSIAGFVLSGAPTWQVDYTYDDPFGTWQPAGIPFPRAFVHPILNGEAGTADGNFDKTVRASRLTLTAVGGAQLVQTQQGN